MHRRVRVHTKESMGPQGVGRSALESIGVRAREVYCRSRSLFTDCTTVQHSIYILPRQMQQSLIYDYSLHICIYSVSIVTTMRETAPGYIALAHILEYSLSFLVRFRRTDIPHLQY